MRSSRENPAGKIIVLIDTMLRVGVLGHSGVTSIGGREIEKDGSPNMYYIFCS